MCVKESGERERDGHFNSETKGINLVSNKMKVNSRQLLKHRSIGLRRLRNAQTVIRLLLTVIFNLGNTQKLIPHNVAKISPSFVKLKFINYYTSKFYKIKFTSFDRQICRHPEIGLRDVHFTVMGGGL